MPSADAGCISVHLTTWRDVDFFRSCFTPTSRRGAHTAACGNSQPCSGRGWVERQARLPAADGLHVLHLAIKIQKSKFVPQPHHPRLPSGGGGCRTKAAQHREPAGAGLDYTPSGSVLLRQQGKYCSRVGWITFLSCGRWHTSAI